MLGDLSRYVSLLRSPKSYIMTNNWLSKIAQEMELMLTYQRPFYWLLLGINIILVLLKMLYCGVNWIYSGDNFFALITILVIATLLFAKNRVNRIKGN